MISTMKDIIKKVILLILTGKKEDDYWIISNDKYKELGKLFGLSIHPGYSRLEWVYFDRKIDNSLGELINNHFEIFSIYGIKTYHTNSSPIDDRKFINTYNDFIIEGDIYAPEVENL